MVEGGRGLRLLHKAPAPIRIRHSVCGKDLDGDLAIQTRVARAIHLAHATCADERDDFVRSELRAGN